MVMDSHELLSTKVEALFPHLVDTLRGLMAIPSVSAPGFPSEPVFASAKYVAELFADLGLRTRVLQAKKPDGRLGQPAVLASTAFVPGQKRVLLYAHHDVQPAGDLEAWAHPPFSALISEGRLYGRGSADDGPGIITHLGALLVLSELMSTHSLPGFGPDQPVGVTVFIEGEEEIGSPSITDLHTHQAELQADVIVVADSVNWQEDVPSLTTSLRGVTDCILELKVLEHAVHSGIFGGPVLDAVTCMCRLLATLHNPDGTVAVSGLECALTTDANYCPDSFKAQASVLPGVQLVANPNLATQLWYRPAINVLGMDVCNVADSASAILPSCRARISLRIPPGISVTEAQTALYDHLHKHTPFGAELSITPGGHGPSYMADGGCAEAQAMRQALSAAWGVKSLDMGLGASIPFIADFAQVFPQAKILITGMEDPDSGAHSAMESISLNTLKRCVLAEALFLVRLCEPDGNPE